MTSKDDVSADFREACREMLAHARGASPDPAPKAPASPLTPDLLEGVGEALFGRNWKTELAEEMDWNDPARIRAMMRGERPIPAKSTTRAIALMQGRIATLEAMIAEVEEHSAQTGIAAE